MTKHWILYILATVGLTALVLWIYRKLGSKETPPMTRDPIVSVSTDDPNMVIPDWDNTKPIWDLGNARDLTTTYYKKDPSQA